MDFDEKKEPKQKIQRKGKKPTRFKPVESTSRSVKALGKYIFHTSYFCFYKIFLQFLIHCNNF